MNPRIDPDLKKARRQARLKKSFKAWYKQNKCEHNKKRALKYAEKIRLEKIDKMIRKADEENY